MYNTLLFLLLLLTKHLIVDFPLQGPYQYKNKGTFLHSGGLLHAGLHGLGTASCLIWFTPLWFAVSCFDFVCHYLIDYSKMNLNRIWNLRPTTSEQFWWLLGLDQYLHQITYLIIIYWVINN